MLLLFCICCAFIKLVLAEVNLTFVDYAKLPPKYAELLANLTDQHGMVLFDTADVRFEAYNYLVNNITEINTDTDACLCQLLTGQYTTDCYIFDDSVYEGPENINPSTSILIKD
ncbi:S. pombe specific UPF0321 family protein 2 [Schizosaccharomyces pombe]|uniref:UPF0321 protein C569.02c n=1 Tax=Schizosaccharomyces pombe (strain 972 / ATCC 24843) TaxID=284812 RepID=YQO2_SCHPO|nr:uncharacterized protein SPCC569.02c [Schizosaccharomyces pombe]Q9Y7S1.1 RecName: Full=UPF0321 protein C569.02c; Flags: Precursor [Schizosaccharomyces pombe 972h-]CAB42063.1 S. pombe specific UPF0321 family protein 2 [Schizosaccharomyces pombe]|eukprot:NP_588571.1 uncharacterized protein SPCC569.02c [Schizosaccharomyces pombe]